MRLHLSFALSVLAGGAVLAQRAPDVRLDTTNPAFSAFSSVPKVSVAGSRVYVVWEDNRAAGGLTHDIYFNRSLDGGKNWLASDVRLDDAPGTVYSATAAIASNVDHVFVAWSDLRDFPQSASIYFNRSLDAGTTWLPTNLRLDVGLGSGSSHPRLVCVGDTVHAVWHETNSPVSIQYSRSVSAGTPGSWTAPVAISGIASANYPPSLAVSGTDVFVVWPAPGAGSYENILFTRSIGGGAFSLPLALDTQPPAVPAGHSSNPQVAAFGSEVYVVWDDGRNGPLGTFNRDIYCNRSTDSGATWLASDVRLDVGSAPGAAGSGKPAIALGTGGGATKVYVAWEDVRNGNADVWFNRSADAGMTWLAGDVRLDVGSAPGASHSYQPQIAATGTSVGVLWIDERFSFGSYQPFFNASVDGGLTWEPKDVRLNTGAGGSINVKSPALAAAGPRTFHAAWEDQRNGPQWDIYTNRWDLGVTVTNAPAGSAAGVTLSLPLDAGLGYLGAAALGVSPGIALSSRVLPLNPDGLFTISLNPAFAFLFPGFVGTLNASGAASAAVNIPAGVPAGFVFYIAFVTIDAGAPDGLRTVTRAAKVTVL
jgi:hypothetical protein